MSHPATPAFDVAAFRRALGSYPTGVTVVTAFDAEGRPRGFTANSFTSVSLAPPLVSVCLAQTAHSHATFASVERYAIHVLASDQQALAALFASKQPDKFECCDWFGDEAGVPRLAGAAARFSCRVHQRVAAGDHTVLIGEVVGFEAEASSPLGYCRGAYVGVAPLATLAAASASTHALTNQTRSA